MRALWVTAVPPDRDGGGGHIRQAHLLHALAERAETHLIVAGQLTDAWVRGPLASATEVDVRAGLGHGSEWRRRLFDLRQLLVGRHPREVLEHARVRAELEARVRAALPADLVVVEYAGLAPLVSLREPASASRWLLTLHNLGSEMALQAAAVDTAGRRRRLLRHEARVSTRFEARITARYDQVVVVSDDDAAVVRRRAPEAAVAVIPNGVDVERYRSTALPDEPVVLFTGALYTTPNDDGVRWFCEELAPRIRARRPDARLVVAGARPTARLVGECQAAGVELHADVPEMRPFIDSARVVVVPLRIGSGTRLKALEAFAAGRPVVGTTIGLGGLDYVPGRHALVADAPDPFAEAVTRLLGDRTLAEGMAADARTLVEQRYGWPGIAQRFVELAVPSLDSVAPTAATHPEGDEPR
jgi:glycosyltransferase involved in cell wall biosynthesis